MEKEPTDQNHVATNKKMENKEETVGTTDDNYQERQIDTSSLYEEIIKGLMKWDSRNGGPESRLVQNIEKFDEKDLGEIFSRTSAQFAGKFVDLQFSQGEIPLGSLKIL